MFNLFKRNISLEKQLSDLKNIGINLCEGMSVETILTKFFAREEYEENPYELLLVSLGGETMNEEEKFIYVSKDIWHLYSLGLHLSNYHDLLV